MELILLSQSEHEVAVTCDGQHSHTFDPQPLQFAENEEKMPLQDDIVAYGKNVYEALFAPGSLARKALAGQPDRLLLVPTTTELDAIPWEYAYGSYGSEDPHAPDYSEDLLLLECPFVRGLPAESRITPPTLKNGLHIVGVSSDPLSDDIAKLDMTADWMVLAESMQDVSQEITLERVRPPTLERVRQVVAGQKELVLYFTGHGGQTEEGALLCFEQENGDLDPVPAKDLVHRLRGAVFLVTLSACVSAKPGPTAFSNLAAALARQKIPYALGMRFSVYEDDARVFTRIFYSELARGSSVEEALLQARLELARGERLWMVGAPVLYTSLTEPAAGFVSREGSLVFKDPSPPMDIRALPVSEGIFQGRQKDLKALGTRLTADQRPRLMTLHAGGGQGKSALARALVERFAWAWPGGVWAISLETLPKRTAFVSKLARFLGVSSRKGATAQEVEQKILQRLAQRRTLLVIDNVETLVEEFQADNPTAQHLVEWINQMLGATSASLLMVSHIFLGWPDESTYDLLGLSDEGGAALFAQSAPQRRGEIDLEMAARLSSKMDGHPLSLRLLAGAFNVSAVTLQAFTETAEVHLQSAEEKFTDLEHGHQRKLYSWIETSLRFLEPSLRERLSSLWIFYALFLPETAEMIFASESAKGKRALASSVRDQLHQLWLCGLLSYRDLSLSDETVSFYYLEPALRPYIQQHLEQVQPREELLKRYGAAYAALLESIYTTMDSQERAANLPQVMGADFELAISYLSGIELATYLCQWGWVVYRQGDVLHSLHLLQQAQELVAAAKKQSLELQITNHLAQVYNHLGQHEKALELYQQALSVRQASADRAGEATTLNNMAEVYRDTGRFAEALPLLEQALPIRREVKDRVGEAATLSNIADVYRKTGQPAEALKFYEQALPITREIENKDKEAVTLNGMAEIYVQSEHFDEAQDLYKQAFELFGLVKDAVARINVMNNRAEISLLQRDFQEAFDFYGQALSFAKTVGDRAGEATTLANQARVLVQAEQLEDALPRYQAALTIVQELEDQTGQAGLLYELAVCQVALQQYEEARATFQAAREKARQISLEKDEIASLIGLASLLYQQLCLPSDAIASLEEALALLQTSSTEKEQETTVAEVQAMLEAMRQGTPLTAEA